MMASKKIQTTVTSAKAGAHNHLNAMDSGFRRNDGRSQFLNFYEFIQFDSEN
jgi:hypothetical protein